MTWPKSQRKLVVQKNNPNWFVFSICNLYIITRRDILHTKLIPYWLIPYWYQTGTILTDTILIPSWLIPDWHHTDTILIPYWYHTDTVPYWYHTDIILYRRIIVVNAFEPSSCTSAAENLQWWVDRYCSGKQPHTYGSKITIFNGQIHYFYGHFP